jgi:hypothetical protein
VRLPIDASNSFSAVSHVGGHHLDHPATLLRPGRSPPQRATPLSLRAQGSQPHWALLRAQGSQSHWVSLPAHGSWVVGFDVSSGR